MKKFQLENGRKIHLRIGKKVQLENGNNSKCKIEIKVQTQMEMKIQLENKNESPFENWTEKSIKITKIEKWWI